MSIDFINFISFRRKDENFTTNCELDLKDLKKFQKPGFKKSILSNPKPIEGFPT